MPTTRSHTLATAWLVTAPLVATLSACGGGNDEPAPPTAQAQCEALASSTALTATTLHTTYRAEGAATGGSPAVPLPAHCVVDASTNARTGVDGKAYAIGYRLTLPDNWNGRFLFMGGGGNDGTIGPATGTNVGPLDDLKPALARGYAVVNTDGGHTGTSGADFATDPLARIDHAYNAFDKTAVNAKALIAQRYGRGPDKSYFVGCSGGGRQGMMFTQRFPGYFDGVVVHAPAMRVASGATIAAMWNNQQLTAIAPVEGGSPILSKALSTSDMALVSNAILTQCDGLDGATDGMVQRFTACHFDPVVLQCAGAKDDSCLSAPQVTALQRIFDGPRNAATTRLYAGQVADPGIDQPGWRAWTLGSSTTAAPNSLYNLLMADALRWEFFTPPDPSFAALDFNIDTDPQRMAAYSSVYDTYADDQLTDFAAHGGKLMFLHGLADPIFSAHDTADYYERLAAHHGGLAGVQSFSRFFPVPGENHCGGGRATDQFDVLTPMVEWVEQGQAPDSITAAAAANNAFFPNRTRPLCPYPKFAKYKGTGSLESADSFSCEAS
ncbi:MAG: tannase/feruloyl esterase family alpha/beta hydrolase [Rhizobacter sp.]|nr:tannase/feruloyl esterase family alpha/beta hydrolase [Rhizobacter sp.]